MGIYLHVVQTQQKWVSQEHHYWQFRPENSLLWALLFVLEMLRSIFCVDLLYVDCMSHGPLLMKIQKTSRQCHMSLWSRISVLNQYNQSEKFYFEYKRECFKIIKHGFRKELPGHLLIYVATLYQSIWKDLSNTMFSNMSVFFYCWMSGCSLNSVIEKNFNQKWLFKPVSI